MRISAAKMLIELANSFKIVERLEQRFISCSIEAILFQRVQQYYQSEKRPFFVFVTIFGYNFAVWGIWKRFVRMLSCRAMVTVELEAGAKESTLRKSSVVRCGKGVIEGFR